MIFRQIDKLHCLLTGYGRESVEEILQRGVSFNMVDERLNGYPRSFETRRASKAVRVSPHDLVKQRSLFRRHTFTLGHSGSAAQAATSGAR